MKKISVLIALQLLFLQLVMSQVISQDPALFRRGLQENDIQLLDVRTQEEFNNGHLKNAMLADWRERDEFVRRVQALDQNDPVYVYCLSGVRSRAAADQLKKMGFRQVVQLEGGIQAWKNAGFEVAGEKNRSTLSMEDFKNLIKGDKPVLVEIGADWCPPCRQMKPVIQELKAEAGNKYKVVKIDGEAEGAIVKYTEVKNYPTFIVYKNGREVWRKEGLLSKATLQQPLLSR